MRRAGAVAFTAVLLLCGATVTVAALERVGSVVLTSVATGQTEYRNFSGNEVTLTARNADISCDSVVVTFDTGRSRGVFAGALPRGREVSIGLPNGSRVLRMDFNCRPSGGLGGVIDIAGGTNALFADRTASQIGRGDAGTRWLSRVSATPVPGFTAADR
jgi:hypothetical protein